MQEIFKRVEIKYLLNEEDYNKIMDKLKNNIIKDKFYFSSICNIYFDTNNYDLIINSIEKAPYKEKIRLRSYGIPNLDDTVFLEIKKKHKGIVNKRRVTLKLKDIYDYLNNHNIPKCNKQIMNEIDYCFKFYDLKPKLFLAYDRYAYTGIDDKNFRLTFDFNIRSRQEDLNLENGDAGNLLFKDNCCIMEAKALGGLPNWFIEILSSLKIYPTSFSKYGTIYKKMIQEEMI